jgi:hypothetical protein
LPPDLKGVELDLDQEGLRKRRPRASRQPAADDETFFAYTEALPRGGGHVLYLFSKRSERLARVQVASTLPGPEAIPVRVQEMQGRHGVPDGVWDCPALGEHPPTRRFTWTRGTVGVMDAYLLLGDHVSTTWMVASTFDVRRAIERAACQPVSPEGFSKFPALPLPTQGEEPARE